MRKEHVTRIGVSLPPKLLEKFDLMIEDMGYANRSEAIRDAVRDYILKNELRDVDGKAVGVISLIYDHHTHGVMDVLTDLQHDFFDVIESSMHLHLDHHNCMELIIVRGEIKKITEIKDRLTSVTGVKNSDFIVTTPVE